MNKETFKSIAAVLAGVFFIIIVTTIVDAIMHAVGAYGGMKERMDDSQAVIAGSYRLVIGIAGGWVTARLAPNHPLRHAIILGVVGTVLGVVGVAVTWNMDLGPRWYPISLAVLAIPQCWLGGWIRAKGLQSKPMTT